MSKSSIAITLSKLKDFKEHILALEQYSTPSEIAADIVWKAYMNKDIKNKTILDAACGPGFFGIAALLLGAKKLFFVDINKQAIDIARENIESLKLKNAVFLQQDIKDFNEKVDVVLQNPPFGTKNKHADKAFLEKAFQVADIIYTMHKIESEDFIKAISRDNNFKITHYWDYDFALKATQRFHKKKIYKVKVGCWRLERC